MAPMSEIIRLAFISMILVATAPQSPSPPPAAYTIALTGEAVSNVAHPMGGMGDLDGGGLVKLTLNPSAKRVCYDFTLSAVSTPLMAHIHHAPRLRNGPPVVTLFTGPGGDLAGCVPWTHSQIAAIVAKPKDFYVSLETTEFPDGALRGQLPA